MVASLSWENQEAQEKITKGLSYRVALVLCAVSNVRGSLVPRGILLKVLGPIVGLLCVGLMSSDV